MTPAPDIDRFGFAVPKGADRYVLLCRADQVFEACQAAARWANDERLSFTAQDSSVLCGRIRQALITDRKPNKTLAEDASLPTNQTETER